VCKILHTCKATDWVKPKRFQFEQALGAQEGTAKVARAPGIATDVAFFYVEKKGKKP